ncbi:hypothetical protein TNCV_4941401 [Trichonephila clavipes]|nr:hypothetical protein TNCV_4941401 [Trichonephila clavipes]
MSWEELITSIKEKKNTKLEDLSSLTLNDFFLSHAGACTADVSVTTPLFLTIDDIGNVAEMDKKKTRYLYAECDVPLCIATCFSSFLGK